jgi:hypothetical protein
MISPCRAWTAISVLAAALATPRPSAACATCACGDPTLTVLGVEKPFVGRTRISFAARHREEEHGPAAHPNRARETRLDIGASVAAAEWLIASLTLPLVRKEAIAANLATDESYGLGDLELRAKWFLLQDRPKIPRHLFGFTGGVDFPLSPLLFRADGRLVPVEAQLSSGALTPQAGLFYSAFLRPWSIHLTATGRVPIALQDHFTPAPALLFTAAGQLQPEPWLALRLSADARLAGRGTEGGEPDRAVEGVSLFLSPEVAVMPLMDLLVSVTARLPVVQVEVRESPVLALTLVYDL